jgi:hypothetical protein
MRGAQPIAASNTVDARAASVLDLLLERGVTVPASVQAEVTATLRAVGDVGDLLAQSTSALAVCVIYTGELPGGEFVEWVASKQKAVSGSSGKVDVRSFLGYQKLHKNSSKTTLERALLATDPSNRKLAVVKDTVIQCLYAAGLPLAATRWQQVLGFAASHFRHDPTKERVYLWGYFFASFLGKGMPEERDRDTLTDMSAPLPGGGVGSSVEAEMRPTIPGESLSGGAAPLAPTAAFPGLWQSGPAGMAEAAAVSAQQLQIDALARAVSALGVRIGGEAPEEPPIKELPAPKNAWGMCAFCHAEHDLTVKCPAQKQALRLKSDWDKAQAQERKAAAAAAKAAGSASAAGAAVTTPP